MRRRLTGKTSKGRFCVTAWVSSRMGEWRPPGMAKEAYVAGPPSQASLLMVMSPSTAACSRFSPGSWCLSPLVVVPTRITRTELWLAVNEVVCLSQALPVTCYVSRVRVHGPAVRAAFLTALSALLLQSFAQSQQYNHLPKITSHHSAQSLPTGGASRTRSSWLAISSTGRSLGGKGRADESIMC
jgi:hypothetical protein